MPSGRGDSPKRIKIPTALYNPVEIDVDPPLRRLSEDQNNFAGTGGGETAQGRHRSGHLRTLTWTSVCFITYFNVCGGPWGSEEIISSAGPLPGLIGLFIMPLTFGLPLGLVTGEMSGAFPGNGG
eukprot:267411-Amorphochlora_amoeboformis.AAC.1